MHMDRRSRGGSAGGLALGLLFILFALMIGSSGTALMSAGASPSPEATASTDVSPLPTPSAAPTAAPSPSASAGIVCEFPIAEADPIDVVGGGPVRVLVRGFEPNTAVTLWFGSRSDVGARPPIGAGTTDGDGAGVVIGVIPADAHSGEAQVTVIASDACWAHAFIIVALSPRAISIDDATVLAGQRVTVRAGGFLPNATLLLSIDSGPTQGMCFPKPCHYLGEARASELGSAVFRVRIPRDTSAGAHRLWVSGYSPDGLSEFSLGVDITVVGADLPQTDLG